MPAKNNGFSLIGMLLGLIIIGILVWMIVPRYLELYKGSATQSGKPGTGGSPVQVRKSAEEKIKKINELNRKRIQGFQ
jgi:competence protein ComGC